MISEEYRKEQEKLHENPEYGVASVSYAPFVSQVIEQMDIKDMLDYGAGKGRLGKNLNVNHNVMVHHYDPAIPGWSETPEPHEFVTCIDVLEHIEPEHLDSVLDDLRRVTLNAGFFTVHTGPAVKTLSDGRNAHLIQKPVEWWLPKIMERFALKSMSVVPNGFWVLVKNEH